MWKRFKRTQGHVWDNTNVTLMLRSFNGLEPGGPESTDKKVKERRRLTFLGLRRKPIRPLAQGVLCLRRPQVPSRWGEGVERLLERVWEAQAGKWTQRPSALQRNSLREREKERERKTRGPELWWSKGVLFNIVWVFILSYKAAIFSRDKIKTYMRSPIWKREGFN